MAAYLYKGAVVGIRQVGSRAAVDLIIAYPVVPPPRAMCPGWM